MSDATVVMTRAQRGRLANDLRLACMRISRRVRFENADTVAPHQLSVLARLEERPCTPRELADVECVSAPSMTRTVGALVERGLAERTDDPDDRRQVIISITAPGRTALREVRRSRDAWMAARLERLSPRELAVLGEASEILARVAAE